MNLKRWKTVVIKRWKYNTGYTPPVCLIVQWLKWSDAGDNLRKVYISWSFARNNVKKPFFTLYLNLFTLFDSLTSSGKPFYIKGPKYDKHFWLWAVVFSGWKSLKEEFLLAVLFWLDVFVNFVHMLRRNFREEFKNAFGKTLFDSFVYWKPVNLVKMFSSDVLSVVQL